MIQFGASMRGGRLIRQKLICLINNFAGRVKNNKLNTKIKTGVALLAILFITRQFYTLSNSYIKQQDWLYGEGYHFTDFIFFGKEDDIKNDTIYKHGHPEAFILHRGYRPIVPNYLVIKSLTTNEVGTYHEK